MPVPEDNDKTAAWPGVKVGAASSQWQIVWHWPGLFRPGWDAPLPQAWEIDHDKQQH